MLYMCMKHIKMQSCENREAHDDQSTYVAKKSSTFRENPAPT